MANAMLDARQEGDSYRRIEVITGQSRRRRWTAEEKARIVAESFETGANISEVARRNGVARGLLTAWRHQFAATARSKAAPALARSADFRRGGSILFKEESMNRTKRSSIATTLVTSALLTGALFAFSPGVVCAQQIAKKGTTPYVTHFIFRPVMSIDIAGPRHRHHAGGGRDHAKHEGREDARQDVGALRSAERCIGRQEIH